MPLTQAEKSKRYREQLKRKNPEKYSDMKKKNKARAIKAYQNKKNTLNDAQKEEHRLKLRQTKTSNRQTVHTFQSTCILESTEEQPLESPLSRESYTQRHLSRESTSRKSTESNADPLSDSVPIIKRQRRAQYSTITKPQWEDRSNHTGNEEAVKECDLYGQLLAQKLKPLDVDDRLVLMNDIDNLVFKYLMNIKRRNKLSGSLHLQSMNQRLSEDRQSIDLPGPSSRSYQTQEGSQQYTQNSQSISEVPFRILKSETVASPEYTT